MTIPFEREAAIALRDDAKRAMVGQVVSRLFRPSSVEDIMDVMTRISDEAERRGLTDKILQAELDAYNAEGRD